MTKSFKIFYKFFFKVDKANQIVVVCSILFSIFNFFFFEKQQWHDENWAGYGDYGDYGYEYEKKIGWNKI